MNKLQYISLIKHILYDGFALETSNGKILETRLLCYT